MKKEKWKMKNEKWKKIPYSYVYQKFFNTKFLSLFLVFFHQVISLNKIAYIKLKNPHLKKK
jgi:hypothetical protein